MYISIYLNVYIYKRDEYMSLYIYLYTYMYISPDMYLFSRVTRDVCVHGYGVATISRLLKTTVLFCERAP